MATRIKFRRGTAASWTAANPVLAQGEPGFETDAGAYKIGDGSSPWAALPYAYIPAKGGLDHGASATERRPLNMASPDVESGASVQALDLRGTPLAIYSTATGTTNGTTVTADSLGRIPGFVVAPDFDVKVTRANASVYYEKVRTSPPGVFHANSYGAVPYFTNITTPVMSSPVDSGPAIQATITAADTSRAWGAVAQLDAGSYVVSTPFYLIDNIKLRGHQRLATLLYKAVSVDTPIIDHYTTSRPLGRYDVEGIHFGCLDPTTHTAAFALVRMNGYLSTWKDIYAQRAPDTCIEWFAGDRNEFHHLVLTGGTSTKGRLGFAARGPFNSKIYAGAFEGFRGAAILLDARSVNPGQSHALIEASFEGIGGNSGLGTGEGLGTAVFGPSFSVACLGFNNALVQANYMLQANVMFDGDSRYNVVRANQMLGCRVYDASGDNHVGPNFQEVQGPAQQRDGHPLSRYFPSPLVRDPFDELRSTGAWTVVGGASLNKNDNYASIRWRGHRSVQPVTFSGSAGKGVYKVSRGLVAGASYVLRVYWFSNTTASVRGNTQVQVVDDATPATVYYDSGTLTPRNSVTGEWLDEFHDTCVEIPAGSNVDARVQFTSTDAAAGMTPAIQLMKNELLNGALEGTYASGVAPSWANSAGTGTPTESTTVFKTGTKAQRLTCASGQNITITQVPGTVDFNCHYLLKADVRHEAGGKVRASLGWVNTDLHTASSWSARAQADDLGEGIWQPISVMFKPSAFTRAAFGAEYISGATGSVVFDNIQLIPLKDDLGTVPVVSPELDLTATAKTYYLVAPKAGTASRRLKRAVFVQTVASAAPASSASVQLGIPGSATYYGTASVPSGNTDPVGTQREIGASGFLFTNTDIKAGVPVQVTWAGPVANAGRGQVLLDYE